VRTHQKRPKREKLNEQRPERKGGIIINRKSQLGGFSSKTGERHFEGKEEIKPTEG